MNQRPPGYEPDELPDCSTPRYEIEDGAGDRGRTGTGECPRDFKSRASANSATPARSYLQCSIIIALFLRRVNSKSCRMKINFKKEHLDRGAPNYSSKRKEPESRTVLSLPTVSIPPSV